MYVPAHFALDEREALTALLRENSFATLFSCGAEGPVATHLPLLLDVDASGAWTLTGHVARANPHWRVLERGGESLAVFAGAHAYISPRWYESPLAVPTWNYEAVHVCGRAETVHERAPLRAIVERLAAVYEAGAPEPWRVEAVPAGHVERLLDAIVGFRLAVSRVEGKRKMSQNRSRADRAGAVAGLRAGGRPGDAAVADIMERSLARD